MLLQQHRGGTDKSQHKKSTLEKKILLSLLQGSEPTTFQSQVQRSNHWAIPAPRREQLHQGEPGHMLGDPMLRKNKVTNNNKNQPMKTFKYFVFYRWRYSNIWFPGTHFVFWNSTGAWLRACVTRTVNKCIGSHADKTAQQHNTTLEKKLWLTMSYSFVAVAV